MTHLGVSCHGHALQLQCTCLHPCIYLQNCARLCCAQTGGRGVDMALNSLADDKLQATVRCLAPHGQLLEIGKYDILKNTPLGHAPAAQQHLLPGHRPGLAVQGRHAGPGARLLPTPQQPSGHRPGLAVCKGAMQDPARSPLPKPSQA